MKFNCSHCSVGFSGYPSRKNLFCSRSCHYESRLSKQRKTFNCKQCGVSFQDSDKHPRKYCSLKCRYSRKENNPNYKGDAVGYAGLHMRISRQLGKPTTCEKCGKPNLTGKKIHWANKSGQYKHDASDWMRLCKGCHQLYDFENFGARKNIYA